MPLRFDSITKKGGGEYLQWIFQELYPAYDDIFTTRDKKYILASKSVIDEKSGGKVGDFVFTVEINEKEKTLGILDVDLVFKNPFNSTLEFSEKLPLSSDANEYYNVDAENGGRFQIETVNRHLVEDEIEGEERAVNLSAFPFKLSIYESIDAFNAEMGYGKETEIGGEVHKIAGFSETFIAPGDLLATGKEPDEEDIFSFVIGTIKSVRKISVDLNGEPVELFLAEVEAAPGNLTTVISPEIFKTETVEAGKTVVMNAVIKANFKLTDKY